MRNLLLRGPMIIKGAETVPVSAPFLGESCQNCGDLESDFMFSAAESRFRALPEEQFLNHM